MNLKKVKKIFLIVLIMMMFVVSNETTLSYLIAKTSPVISKFIPHKYLSNNVVISNKIEHSLGVDYEIPSNIEFKYEINFGKYYANQLISTSMGNYTTDEEGIIYLNIKGENDLIINEIDEGTKIVVTNTNNNIGFSIKDEISKEIVVSIKENNNIEFINIYKPEEVTGENITVTGTKVLEGRDWQDEDSFKFNLEYFNEDNKWEVISVKEIKYDKDNIEFNKFDFSDIIKKFSFNKVKEYKFRISEVIGNLDNVDYDKTINDFKIIISDKLMDGVLEIDDIVGYQNINVSKNNDKYNIEVVFNSKYVEPVIPEIEYSDKIEHSTLIKSNLLVRNTDYDIDTIIKKFDGLSSDYSYKIYDKFGVEQTTKIVRTGDSIKIKSYGVEYTYTLVLSGDVDGNGEISYLDYVKVYNHIQKVKNPESDKKELYDEYLLAADMSNEGKINYLDYVKIYNKIKETKGDAE